MLFRRSILVAFCSVLPVCAFAAADSAVRPARDPKQPIDPWYTQQIKKYTTEPSLNSSLTDYLPASKTVPTPAKILGDVSGAPDMLPYAEDVYKYFRLLASSTPRVQVFSIGHSEEGREMIAAAVADESLLSGAKANNARLAQLADPRTIGLDDAKAQSLVAQSYPVYYITGTIHSVETGAPTALMELAYRLAVDDSPYIRFIRSHMIVLITPVVEVDGRDRMVDIYRWHKAHPNQNWPRLLYWGHYVAHDNNRDAMGMTLNLTRNVLDTYLDWHAQVLHDLHESVPFLYDNTVGDGPYNAWVDPLLTDEWAMLGWNNVGQLQAQGMPGAFTHGNFDTWSPGYLMFLAAMHNGISRLYETFGNGGADTVKRILTPEEYERTWYRPNPPYPTVLWSQRDNNNYEQTALLTTLSYFAQNTQHFLSNYYLKSKRSVQKPDAAGPAAYVLAADEGSWNRQVQLLNVLKAQHIEVSQLDEKITVTNKKIVGPGHSDDEDDDKKDDKKEPKKDAKSDQQTFAPGSYVVRMDQPFSRAADALLDRQYWSPEDPQREPYDDTGWSFGDLFNVKAVRVTDKAVLSAKMHAVNDFHQDVASPAQSAVYAIANTGQVTLAALRFALKSATFSAADQPFDSAGHHYSPGTVLIADADPTAFSNALKTWGLNGASLPATPSIHTHALAAPRIALMHTWLYTQTEGWWRLALDKLGVPYEYINTQTASREADLRSKYDVIIFAPTRVSTEQVIDGIPQYGPPIPWQKTTLTPNIGVLDSTDDMRPGLGFAGVDHLKTFIEAGGLLITSQDTAKFAIDEGLAPGVFLAPKKNVRVVGSVLNAVVVDKNNPVSYGYGPDFGVYSEDGMAFTVSNSVREHSLPTAKEYKRPTGRGGPEEEDVPEGRSLHEPAPLPSPKTWEATPLNEEQSRNNPFIIPVEDRPNVIVRYAAGKSLLLSGLLEESGPIAEHPAVVLAHLGKGHVLLFANNPMYRGETIGSYSLVLNALLNFDHLHSAEAK